LLLLSFTAFTFGAPLRALVIDGMNNHDWKAGTRAIRSILEGSGRFRVDVCTYPAKPDFKGYDVVINNFNGGHLADGTRWPRDVETALAEFVRKGGGLVSFHAANNAFLNWPEYNDMIGLLWRDKSFGTGLAIGPGGAIVTIPKGQGLAPGHGPRHDFEMEVLDAQHPITRGLPKSWMHPSEQLTHGQHGPAADLHVLTYAFSPVSQQGEPMDWVHPYGKGRVYVTMLGHTWKDEQNPNLDDVAFQALLARGTEWAATGQVTLAANLGWEPLLSKGLDAWETRGKAIWTLLPDGTLAGQRTHPDPEAPFGAPWPLEQKVYRNWLGTQAWLYTKREYDEFDFHSEYWLPIGGNSGISIRDPSRAHFAIREPDSVRPELAKFPATSPAHIGYEIQILDDDTEKYPYPTGSIYDFVPGKRGLHQSGKWNTMDIESRHGSIRVFVNGDLAAEGPGDPARPKVGPIGLQMHDQFTSIWFRNLRIRVH
jgi:type 1 glutamine amidotransferase